ncbi:sister chromatid cohesion protein-like protein Mis4 [Amniculicola lignicola CBS 123094]|uniref:Sister chromatid cohesion protein n=1 Tax=Amniculicola lignicola CBS 123094 TaxID=1392246 RepID=A0A6A5VZI1_9PLEO|nr:sister chromatid cohesion protein-like protein Mis4 [Amniculicola lignicola CBS 123094]
MSGSNNAHWHTFNGGGLPFRPPSVDEALPYSPFTSIVPFSPDIIPFPSAEPATPPTTLSEQQQDAARRAFGILNDEIRGPPTAAQHLHHTLSQLQNLLNPSELTELRFKSISQLATPPPDSPTTDSPSNSTVPSQAPALSPFAALLLRTTDVSRLYARPQASQQPLPAQARPVQAPVQRTPSQQPVRTESRPQPPGTNGTSYSRDPSSQFQPTPPSSSAVSNTTPSRPGPAVMVKPLKAPREEYQRYEKIQVSDSPRRKLVGTRPKHTVTTEQRQIVDRKIQELRTLIADTREAKDEFNDSNTFTTLTMDGSDILVLQKDSLKRIFEAVSGVANTGCFHELDIDDVLNIQSLCEPSVAITTELVLEPPSEDATNDWLDCLSNAENGVRACRLILETMVNGAEDRRTCSEDHVRIIIKALKRIVESCIIPIVESRRNDASSSLFRLASECESKILPVLLHCGYALSLLAVLIGKINFTETSLSPLEYMCFDTIFAQNSETDKDSALKKPQRFESFRQKAMDVLAQIFASHAEQRQPILNEILSNLERLPEKRANARQFKSAHLGEHPIMLVSALFLRLVQATASKTSAERMDAIQAQSDDSEGSEDELASPTRTRPKHGDRRSPTQIASQLMGNATSIAAHIAQYLIQRAINVSKSGDKPFRNLLDGFVEDFCRVFGSPEWPAAELILERLMIVLWNMSAPTNDKSVNERHMALSILSIMACGIVEFKIQWRKKLNSLDISQSDLSSELVRIGEFAREGSVNKKDLLSFDGPYRVVLESLPSFVGVAHDDQHLQSINGTYITFWIHAFTTALDTDGGSNRSALEPMQADLMSMAVDPAWLSKQFDARRISETQIQVAAGIITLQSRFCSQLPQLVQGFIGCTKDPSSKIQSRAMQNLNNLLKLDPSIFNEQTFKALLSLLSDKSSLVKSNTIDLVTQSLERDPGLERFCLEEILRLVTEPQPVPQKKAIKALKDIYFGKISHEKKLRIIISLLPPVMDDEKTVADLARQTLEDILLTFPYRTSKDGESQLKLARSNRVSLLMHTVHNIQGNPRNLEAFEKFFKIILSQKAKDPENNFRICKEIVADIANSEEKDQTPILQTLSIFAKVNPNLFTIDLVEPLKIYLKNLANTDDLKVFRHAVTIFRYTLPSFEKFQGTFLEQVRQSLAESFKKLLPQGDSGQPIFVDVVRCMWTISPLVPQGLEKLFTTFSSAFCQIQTFRQRPRGSLTPKENTRLKSFLVMVGGYGKICDFGMHIDLFKRVLRNTSTKIIMQSPANKAAVEPLQTWKGNSVPILMVESVKPFTMQGWDMDLRKQALSSLADICENSPDLFMRADVEKSFELVFKNEDADLKKLLLHHFLEFLSIAERRSETGAEIAVGEGAARGAERLDSSLIGSGREGAPLHIAQKYLNDIVGVALGGKDDLAFLATEIITSVSRQGLEHPKKCGGPLVALSTSPNLRISDQAFTEHQNIHRKLESTFEKEYMAAVALAFDYQINVFQHAHGVFGEDQRNPKPKLARAFSVIQSGTRKTIKKFIHNFARQADFDLSTLEASGEEPRPLLFASFCLENLGLFDYAKNDEVHHLIFTLRDLVLKQTGPTVALAIETEIPKDSPEVQQFDPPDQLAQLLEPTVADAEALPLALSQKPPVSNERLRQLAVASMILHMMWETKLFLQKQWKISDKATAKALMDAAKGKTNEAKGGVDFNRPAQRNNLISGDMLLKRFAAIMSGLQTPEGMRKECFDFALIVNMDSEHQIDPEELEAQEQLEMMAAGYETPDEGESERAGSVPSSGKGRKRKATFSSGGTPKKARGRSAGTGKKKRSSKTPEGEDWE